MTPKVILKIDGEVNPVRFDLYLGTPDGKSEVLEDTFFPVAVVEGEGRIIESEMERFQRAMLEQEVGLDVIIDLLEYLGDRIGERSGS